MAEKKRVVVEEIVIDEECDGDDDEGEWELGEDGCWYCVVDEYYEEEMVSPGGENRTTNKTKENPTASPRIVPNRNSPRKQLIGKPSPRSAFQTSRTQSNMSPRRKEFLGSGRMSSSAELLPNITQPMASPNRSSFRKKFQKKTPSPTKPQSKDEACENPTIAPAKRFGGAATLQMSSMRSSPSNIVAQAKSDMIQNGPTRSPMPVMTKNRNSYRSRDILNRAQSSEAISANKITTRRKSLVDDSPDVVFGALLDDVIAKQVEKGKSSEIPLIVEWTVKEIRERGMKTNGIFRQSGHHGKQINTQQLIDRGASCEELKLNELDVHTVGALLRSYLRSLPSSVIPRVPFFPLLVQVAAFSDKVLRLNSFKSILNCLPPARFRLVKYLTLFLKDVASHCEENLMSLSNLALVFAPSFFGTIDTDITVRKEQIDPMTMAKESKFTSMLTEEILSEADFLFNDVGEPACAYEALECFKPSNERHLTLLRGDTFVVLGSGSSDVTILIGDTTGKIPQILIPTMKKIPLEEVKTREIITLFASKSSKTPASIRVGNVLDVSPVTVRSSKKSRSRRFTDVLRFNSTVSKRSSMIVSPRT